MIGLLAFVLLSLVVGIVWALWPVPVDEGHKGKSGEYENYVKQSENEDGSVNEVHVSISDEPSHDKSHRGAPIDVPCNWIASPTERGGGHWDCNYAAAGYVKTGTRWVK